MSFSLPFHGVFPECFIALVKLSWSAATVGTTLSVRLLWPRVQATIVVPTVVASFRDNYVALINRNVSLWYCCIEVGRKRGCKADIQLTMRCINPLYWLFMPIETERRSWQNSKSFKQNTAKITELNTNVGWIIVTAVNNNNNHLLQEIDPRHGRPFVAFPSVTFIALPTTFTI